MNLNKYNYKHIKTFIKDSADHHKMMNFKGEVYEASFYETVVHKAQSDCKNEIKIAAKGPYSKVCASVKRGFFNDKNGSLIFNSNSISLAEFDCLELSKDTIHFYECTLSQKPENLKTLRSEALRKTRILEIIFPNKEITCTIVSDNEKTLEYFRKAAGFHTLHHEFSEINLIELAKSTIAEKAPQNQALISANALNNKIAEFDYLKELESICSIIFEENSISQIAQKVILSRGLFQRLYWGKIPIEEFESTSNLLGSKEIIVSINFSNIRAPRLRYYFTNDEGRSFYELLPTPKKLSHWKSSRVELIRIHQNLPSRTKQDLEFLEHELADWHNSWFKPFASLTGGLKPAP